MSKTAEQIARLKEEIRKLEAEAERLAEIVHDIHCRSNHADGCGWFYESWEKPGSTRKWYAAVTQRLLIDTDRQPEELIPILEALVEAWRTTRVP